MNDNATALARAHLYGFFAAVFSAPPDGRLLAALRAGTLAALLEELGVAAAGLAAGLEDEKSAWQELAVAFTRLMIGPGQGYVPPYGCIWLDLPTNGSRSQLWSPSTLAILDLYRDAGLEPVNGQIPDHLAAELEFMRYLCEKEAEAAEKGDRDAITEWRRRQATVLHEHLGRWVPRWAKAAIQVARHPFYVAMAHLTVLFLEDELATEFGIG